MKRLFALLVPLFTLSMSGCLDILGPSSEEEKVEMGPYIERTIFTDHRMEGNTLVVDMLYSFYPQGKKGLEELMVRADTARFEVHYTNTNAVDTMIVTKNTWNDAYRFSDWSPKNKKPLFIDAYILGNDKK